MSQPRAPPQQAEPAVAVAAEAEPAAADDHDNNDDNDDEIDIDEDDNNNNDNDANVDDDDDDDEAAPLFHEIVPSLVGVFREVHDLTKYLLRFLGPRDQRSFLNASRGLADMKRHLLYWKFNEAQSREYYERPMFRRYVQELLVNDPSRQVALQFNGDTDLGALSVLGNVHALTLSNITTAIDVAGLGNLTFVTIRACPDIVNLAAVGSVHNVSLESCHGITDVGGLGGVRNLKLVCCRNLSGDLSGLGGCIR